MKKKIFIELEEGIITTVWGDPDCEVVVIDHTDAHTLTGAELDDYAAKFKRLRELREQEEITEIY